jgi:hypothetical protein
METIISDADVDSYKNLHYLVKNHEGEINKLNNSKVKVQKQIDQINQDVKIIMLIIRF